MARPTTLILADVKKSFDIDGKQTEEALDKIGLNLNKNSVADDPLPPFRPSGIRLSTPAITTRGLTPDHAANCRLDASRHQNRDNDAKLQELRQSPRVCA